MLVTASDRENAHVVVAKILVPGDFRDQFAAARGGKFGDVVRLA
jgi:hypothetical protein